LLSPPPIVFVDCLVIVIALAALAIAGDFFVQGAAAIGGRLGLSSAAIGATVVAIGTSLPEWAVAVGAALQGYSGLSAGAVVGSNVCNVCIILGLSALVTPLLVSRRWVRRDGALMIAATVAFIAVAWDGAIGRLEGILLLLGAVAVITIHLVSREEETENEAAPRFRLWDPLRAAAALAVVLTASHFFVQSATRLATAVGVSPWIIGITVAAIGTSLPELVTCLAAAWRKRPGMVFGNLLGSNCMNILFVLGSAATLSPIKVAELNPPQALIFAGLTLLPVVMMNTRLLLARWEGGLLVACGLGWILLESLRA